MQVIIHHIYELKKGLRKMALHTSPSAEEAYIRTRLERDGIPYLIHKISGRKINIFFGDQDCINMLKHFSTLSLNELTDYEDFILGTLLGYDTKLQCQRFLERRGEYGNQQSNALRA